MTEKTVSDSKPHGTVHVGSRKVTTFDVTVYPLQHYDSDFDADEFLLMVNGRVVKRLLPFQAERLGLLSKS